MIYLYSTQVADTPWTSSRIIYSVLALSHGGMPLLTKKYIYKIDKQMYGSAKGSDAGLKKSQGSIFTVVRSSETTKKSYGRPKHYKNLSAGRLKFDLTKKKILFKFSYELPAFLQVVVHS